MISSIIKMVQSDNWYNLSPAVEIAKGKYELVDGWKKFTRRAKRLRKSKFA